MTAPIEKNIKSRIQHKHDTEANWQKAENFVPLIGEIIVYDPDTINENSRIKIGDGITTASNLPFITDVDINNLSAGVRIPESETNSVGSSIQPVYWHNGRPYATSYSLEPISSEKIEKFVALLLQRLMRWNYNGRIYIYVPKDKLVLIADAIRAKAEKTDKITFDHLVELSIMSITSGEYVKGYEDGLQARTYENWSITLVDGEIVEKEVALL